MLNNKPQGYIEFTTETAAIPSLADVLWVYEDEGESFAKSRYRQCLYNTIIKTFLKLQIFSSSKKKLINLPL